MKRALCLGDEVQMPRACHWPRRSFIIGQLTVLNYLTGRSAVSILLFVIVPKPPSRLSVSQHLFIFEIGHFRITFGLFFKASPGAHPFIWKLVFICVWMKTIFHMKGWAPGLSLKKRPKVIRKWPITDWLASVLNGRGGEQVINSGRRHNQIRETNVPI